VIIDDMGCSRSDFPHSMYLVAGSQAEKPKDNCVFVMKVYILLNIPEILITNTQYYINYY